MGLTGADYVALLTTEAKELPVPDGPLRRTGSLDKLRDCLTAAREGIAWQAAELSRGEREDAQCLDGCVDRAMEIASYLYVGGTAPETWRRWAALAAVGLTARGNLGEGCAWAAVAGEWGLVDAMRSLPAPAARPPLPALWQLATGAAAPAASEHDPSWQTLLETVPAAQHGRTEAALVELAESWMDEYEDEWDEFHPHSWPDFDSDVCAAAAVAKRRGYRPAELPEDVRRYLEAGLDDGYPTPLYPTVSPFDAAAG